MADDVINKIKSSQNIVQGDAILYVDKRGNYQKVSPNIVDAVNIPAVSGKYTNRFDDVGYY